MTLEKGGSDALVEDVGPYLRLITRKYGVRQPKKEKKWVSCGSSFDVKMGKRVTGIF